jgi:hypothetical protein
MKHTCRRKLKQFVIIPTIGFAWGDNRVHFYFAWLRFRIGFIAEQMKGE